MNSFNHKGNYVCECGKEFENSQSFNGHKTHCKVHQITKYGNLDKFENAETVRIEKWTVAGCEANKKKSNNSNNKKMYDLQVWVEEQHVCEHCGKVMTEKFGSGRFCCKSCANSRIITDDQKNKTSLTLKNGYRDCYYNYVPHSYSYSHSNIEHYKNIYYKNPKYCIDCGKLLKYDQRHKDRCLECGKIHTHKILSETGKKSASIQAETRRSKNEIYFCELCENYFKDVKHNEPIFNGWDADVIIEDIKYAVLWNGRWHYEKITKKHSVKQVQNRDKIKIGEIIKSGYTPYVIKDMGKANKSFVEEQFNLFIDSLQDI